MAIDIEYYRKISGSYNCDTKQDQIKSSISNNMINNFSSTLGYETVLINDVSKGVIIQNKSSKNSLYVTKQVTMQPHDEINMGDLIEWNNSYWLCTQADDVHGIYHNGLIRECNNTLKFYNNYTLYEVPCVFDTSLLVEDEKQFMTISDDTFSLFCRNDSDSSLIDHNTRFLLSGNAYKVEGIDNLRYVGILEIKLRKDQIQTANDNVDLGIADYGLNQPSYQVTILNGASAELFYGNETLQLNVEVKRDGEILTNPTITYTTSNALVATVSTSGLITCKGTGDCNIIATYCGISDSIAIHGDIDQQTIYTVTMTPTISTIKANTTMTLEAYGMNNGVEDLTRQFNWSIRNSDNSNNIYATITPNNKTCILSAKGITNKFIIVRATLTSDPTVYFDKEIKIINLF